MIARNYIGTRFGTRVCIDQKKGRFGTRVVMKCDCGRTSETSLSASKTRGCRHCASKKHGHASKKSPRTPTYRTWASMITRCRNPRHAAFSRYGGAGIVVCEKWLQFDGFLEDMGERPEKTTLDRIDNSLGYFKENCRWATVTQQQRNRSSNALVTINGDTKCITEWSELTGIKRKTIAFRVMRGWADDRILSPTKSRVIREKY